MTTIRYWFNEFKRGRTPVFDEDRPGHPTKESTTDIVMEDRRIKAREFSHIYEMYSDCVYNILQWFGYEEVVCKTGALFADSIKKDDPIITPGSQVP